MTLLRYNHHRVSPDVVNTVCYLADIDDGLFFASFLSYEHDLAVVAQQHNLSGLLGEKLFSFLDIPVRPLYLDADSLHASEPHRFHKLGASPFRLAVFKATALQAVVVYFT